MADLLCVGFGMNYCACSCEVSAHQQPIACMRYEGCVSKKKHLSRRMDLVCGLSLGFLAAFSGRYFLKMKGTFSRSFINVPVYLILFLFTTLCKAYCINNVHIGYSTQVLFLGLHNYEASSLGHYFQLAWLTEGS